ncbi:MAG: hypothetical protein RI897_2724 [Verrucomicrobiota bacterium]
MAGDHGGFRQAEQVHGVGDLIRVEGGAEGGSAGVFLEELFPVGEVFEGIGIDDPCADDIGADALRAEFLGEATDHGFEGGFGGADEGVVGYGAGGAEAGEGEDTSAFGHSGDGLLGEEVDGERVGFEAAAPVFEIELEGGFEDADGGVGDEEIDGGEVLGAGFEGFLDAGGVTDVGLDGEAALAELLDFGTDRFGFIAGGVVGHHDIAAGGCEFFHDRAADAARSAADEGSFALEWL